MESRRYFTMVASACFAHVFLPDMLLCYGLELPAWGVRWVWLEGGARGLREPGWLGDDLAFLFPVLRLNKAENDRARVIPGLASFPLGPKKNCVDFGRRWFWTQVEGFVGAAACG